MEDIVRFILEDILADAFAGLFRLAKSPRIRRWKWMGWLCAIASFAAFTASAFLPQGNGFELAIGAGLTAGLAALGCGFWASVENLRFQNQISPQ